MPDGPKVALILLLLLLPVLGVGIYLVERRHASQRDRKRGAERLPLFGTDQLATGFDGAGDEQDEDGHLAAAAAISRAPLPRNEGPVVPRPHPLSTSDRDPYGQPADLASARRAEFVSRPTPAFSSARIEEPMSAMLRPVGAPSHGFGSNGSADHDALDAALVEGETVRFSVPMDGTVEFLPGRLEVVAGPDSGREIRFVRTPGETNVEVTFGRSEGPPNRHIQILARTVSRRHALMSLLDDHWQLTNVSATNPLILNGRVLAGNEVAPLLIEGDRIEMGEVVFIFHDV